MLSKNAEGPMLAHPSVRYRDARELVKEHCSQLERWVGGGGVAGPFIRVRLLRKQCSQFARLVTSPVEFPELRPGGGMLG